MSEARVFTASRLTGGNLIFPTRIEITPDRVARIKPHWIGRNEDSIPIAKIASVSIATGLIFSSIRVESSGGATPIVSEGHYKRDAIAIRDLIHTYQSGTRT
ncbi:MAG TPA: PH domain-containing protein [Candidatus Polarisedimenticolaceae bacterium]|nr:PH domain-containing protein [Candidatus Polarisedimenticolaceae bacterium]